MSSRATRRTLRSRSSTRRSLRPTIDHLESRLLLTTTPLLAYPTFEIGLLAGGGGPAGGYTPATDTATSSITGTESGITVRATPQVTWSSPASIVYGTPLGTVQLDASANVAGTFTYHPAAGAILDAGAGQALSVTFTPTDATNYTTATGTTTITVTQATPTISLTAPGGTFDGSPFPASVTIAGVSGTPGSSLEGVSPSLTYYYSGTYSNPTQLAGLTPLPGATVHAGAYTVLASFPAPADYAAATGLANFTIAQATPQVTWSPPASIVYGTTLSAAQLDASANVPGTFTYTPPLGALLDAGSGQTLSVTFTPQAATDYAAAAASTTITVTKATPILKVTDAGGRFDGSPFPASVAIFGAVAGVVTPASSLDNVTPTLTYYDGSGTAGTSLGPAPPSAPGIYTVVAAFSGTVDYSAILSTPLTFTIGQAAAALALASSGGSAVYGQPVSFLATVGAVAGTTSGTVTFFDGTTRLATVPLTGSGTAMFTTSTLSLGSHSMIASYSGDADFLGVQSAPHSEIVAQTGTEVVVVQNSVFNKRKLMSVRLTAEIKPLAPGGGVPTGEVTFEVVTTIKKTVKVTTLGTAAVSGGEATLTLKASKLPQQGITIVYSGDANDKASKITTLRLT